VYSNLDNKTWRLPDGSDKIEVKPLAWIRVLLDVNIHKVDARTEVVVLIP